MRYDKIKQFDFWKYQKLGRRKFQLSILNSEKTSCVKYLIKQDNQVPGAIKLRIISIFSFDSEDIVTFYSQNASLPYFIFKRSHK